MMGASCAHGADGCAARRGEMLAAKARPPLVLVVACRLFLISASLAFVFRSSLNFCVPTFSMVSSESHSSVSARLGTHLYRYTR